MSIGLAVANRKDERMRTTGTPWKGDGSHSVIERTPPPTKQPMRQNDDAVRRFLQSQADDVSKIDDAVLIFDELVTNVVEHAPGRFRSPLSGAGQPFSVLKTADRA